MSAPQAVAIADEDEETAMTLPLPPSDDVRIGDEAQANTGTDAFENLSSKDDRPELIIQDGDTKAQTQSSKQGETATSRDAFPKAAPAAEIPTYGFEFDTEVDDPFAPMLAFSAHESFSDLKQKWLDFRRPGFDKRIAEEAALDQVASDPFVETELYMAYKDGYDMSTEISQWEIVRNLTWLRDSIQYLIAGTAQKLHNPNGMCVVFKDIVTTLLHLMVLEAEPRWTDTWLCWIGTLSNQLDVMLRRQEPGPYLTSDEFSPGTIAGEERFDRFFRDKVCIPSHIKTPESVPQWPRIDACKGSALYRIMSINLEWSFLREALRQKSHLFKDTQLQEVMNGSFDPEHDMCAEAILRPKEWCHLQLTLLRDALYIVYAGSEPNETHMQAMIPSFRDIISWQLVYHSKTASTGFLRWLPVNHRMLQEWLPHRLSLVAEFVLSERSVWTASYGGVLYSLPFSTPAELEKKEEKHVPCCRHCASCYPSIDPHQLAQAIENKSEHDETIEIAAQSDAKNDAQTESPSKTRLDDSRHGHDAAARKHLAPSPADIRHTAARTANPGNSDLLAGANRLQDFISKVKAKRRDMTSGAGLMIAQSEARKPENLVPSAKEAAQYIRTQRLLANVLGVDNVQSLKGLPKDKSRVKIAEMLTEKAYGEEVEKEQIMKAMKKSSLSDIAVEQLLHARQGLDRHGTPLSTKISINDKKEAGPFAMTRDGVSDPPPGWRQADLYEYLSSAASKCASLTVRSSNGNCDGTEGLASGDIIEIGPVRKTGDENNLADEEAAESADRSTARAGTSNISRNKKKQQQQRKMKAAQKKR